MLTTKTPPKINLISGEELLAMGDIGRCELIDGRIVPMSPTGVEHAFIEFNLGSKLETFVRQHKLGWVLGGEVGIYIRRNPDRVRGADIVFISKEKLSRPQRGFLEIAPELVVEIISPGDRWEEIREKLADYFSIGVEQVWLVEPARKEILVYHSTTELQELSAQDTLTGTGKLKDFRLNISELFKM